VIANATRKELKSSGAIQAVVWTEVRGSSTLFDVVDMGSSSVEIQIHLSYRRNLRVPYELLFGPHSASISSYCTVTAIQEPEIDLNSYSDHNDIINEFKPNS
jgi:hypothetical protein